MQVAGAVAVSPPACTDAQRTALPTRAAELSKPLQQAHLHPTQLPNCRDGTIATPPPAPFRCCRWGEDSPRAPMSAPQW